jgi:PAS domain-containing protein
MFNKTNVGLNSHNGKQDEFADLVTLFNSIPALVAFIDCNMVLQFYNQPFKKWFNINGELAGQKFPLVTGPEIFDQVQRHMGKVLTGECAHFQVSVNDQYLDVTLSPHFDQQNLVKGFIFHSSDITEKSRNERALKDYFENASINRHDFARWVRFFKSRKVLHGVTPGNAA